MIPGGNLSGQGADALAALIKAGAALHWLPTVTLPGAMADDLGSLAMQALADVMGCPVAVGDMSRYHEGERHTPKVQQGEAVDVTARALAKALLVLADALRP